MNEVKRRTEKVEEALAVSDTELACVIKAVHDVNETLAVHAAWTEERFEAMDDRLVSLARVQAMASSRAEMQMAAIDSRLIGLGTNQPGLNQTLARLEQNQSALIQAHAAKSQQAEHLQQSQEALRQEVTALVETMRGLTTRVGEVLAYAISHEIEQHTTSQHANKQSVGEGFTAP